MSTPAEAIPTEKTKKPLVKKWWFWAIIAVVAIGAVSAIGGGGKTSEAEPATTTKAVAETPVATAAPKPTTEAAKPAPKPTTPAVPAEYTSALKQAKVYVEAMHMSKAGVYDQLVSEYGGKFSAEAAQYAIDNLKADYNAAALASAKTYQDAMSMSPEAIRDQLVSEYGGKFTQEEADYAVANLGG